VGPGGHHFGTEYTLARYQDEFYLPSISDRSNFETWTEHGAKDAYQRAHEVAHQLLETYQQPALDSAVHDELFKYVERRKTESTVTYT
jgi:trimethylamine--corrinoid protein Co-methyltransferase